jgi:putative membrane protein
MVKIVYGFLLLVLVVFGVVFAVLNADPVELHYYFGSTQLALSLVLVLAMILGALLGLVACAGMILNSRREVARLKKAVELAEKEVANLRAIPIRDNH